MQPIWAVLNVFLSILWWRQMSGWGRKDWNLQFECYIHSCGKTWWDVLYNLLFLSSFLDSDLLKDAGELTEVLCEFDAVIEDFSSPINERHFQYEEHLERMKRRSSASVSDCSGISDSESEKLVAFDSTLLPFIKSSHLKINFGVTNESKIQENIAII